MWNSRLDEAQAGIKIARRNTNKLRYEDDTTLMAASKEELNSLLMKVKTESEKAGLKLSIQKAKIMASGPITLWKITREKKETVTDLVFLGSRITVDDCTWWLHMDDYHMVTAAMKLKDVCSLKEKLWQT